MSDPHRADLRLWASEHVLNPVIPPELYGGPMRAVVDAVTPLAEWVCDTLSAWFYRYDREKD